MRALFVIFVIALILIGPILTIWSLNVLFPLLVIPYTLNTYLATAILSGVIGGSYLRFNKD